MTVPEGVIPPQQLRVMQIIAGALLAGVLTFLALALVKVHVLDAGRPPALAGPVPLISYMAAGFLVVVGTFSYIMPRVVTQAAIRQLLAGNWQVPEGADPRALPTFTAKLLMVYQTSLIIGLALLEGPAFFLLIAYLLEAQIWVLLLVAVPLVHMAVRFPTEASVRAWLDQQADALAAQRQSSPS